MLFVGGLSSERFTQNIRHRSAFPSEPFKATLSSRLASPGLVAAGAAMITTPGEVKGQRSFSLGRLIG